MSPQVISVSEFVGLLNTVMGEAFPRVVVEGEVSEWKVWNNQRVYFKLKDDKGAMDCVMWSLPRVQIESGMSVRVGGKPSVYAARGSLSFSVSTIEPAGEGALRRAYELLKAKLTAEGLFAPERKRVLPEYPVRIGLITADGSAAFADFMKILNARFGGLTVEFLATQVQGVAAPGQIVGAIKQFNEATQPVDVLVLVRGGGSLEDLQAFNDEGVVRAVASSRIPTLVGVGHEVDTSLADLVADVRAATPTDAAGRLVPDRAELARGLVSLRRSLDQHLDARLLAEANALGRRTERLHRYLEHLGSTLRHQYQYVERIADRFGNVLQRYRNRLDTYSNQLTGQLDRLTTSANLRVERADDGLSYGANILNRRVVTTRESLAQIESFLGAVNPRSILGKGYAIARHDGAIVRDGSSLKAGSELVIELAQDSLTTNITEVHRGHKK